MRKTLCVLLAAVLVLGMAVPAFAGEDDSAELERVIKNVKRVILIPESASEFDYSSWYYNDEDKKSKVWSLSWSDTEGGRDVNVMADKEGTLLSYYEYEDRGEIKGLGNLTKEKAQTVAEAFIKKALPAAFQDVRLASSRSVSDAIVLDYQVYIHNIPVDFMIFSVMVDRFSEQVRNYAADSLMQGMNMTFPKADRVIGADKAKAAYLEKLGVELCYKSNYNQETKKLDIFAVYEDRSRSRYIDALNAEPVKASNEIYYAAASGGGSVNEAAKEDATAWRLSPQEQSAVDNAAGLISQAAAESIIKEKAPAMNRSAKVQSANLAYDALSEVYSWGISFDSGYGSVDAKSGRLLSFRVYKDQPESGKSITKERALATAEAFLSDVAPQWWEQVKLSESQSDFEQEEYYRIRYNRIVNGLEYDGDSLLVEIAGDGKIYSYTSSWHANTSFPIVEKSMEEEAAFDFFAEDKGYDLKYISGEQEKARLVYGFTKDKFYYLEPFSGEKLTNRGAPYKEQEGKAYPDIAGKWYESAVRKLLDNGYFIDSERFEGNQQITQEGFLRYLYSPRNGQYTATDEFYDLLLRQEIVKEEEKAPEQRLSRQDAVKFVIRYLGQGLSAEHSELFKNVFRDAVADEYLGYAAVAKALGIIQGDSNGKFNGTGILTNAQAAVIIVNTVELQ